jgi:hypothetical protein
MDGCDLYQFLLGFDLSLNISRVKPADCDIELRDLEVVFGRGMHSVRFQMSLAAVGSPFSACESNLTRVDNLFGSVDRYGPPRPINKSTSSTKSFELAQNWLTSCISSHSYCSEEKTSFSPIARPGQDWRTRLARPSSHMPYVALGYYWGKTQIMPNKQSEGSWCTSIPLDALSQTIKDAIRVTEKLGVKYLWVDALCM